MTYSNRMSTGRRLDLRLERVGDGRRVALDDCDDSTDFHNKRCTEFCTDASMCATFMNAQIKQTNFSASLGPNQIVASTNDAPEKMSFCFPKALLATNFRRSGKECVPDMCHWKDRKMCPYEGGNLPFRVNDNSFDYKVCCDH